MSLIGHNSKSTKLIIDITDIYDQRDRKKKELKFYTVELEKLMAKLGMIQQDIGVTETIIRLIENEQILDLQEAISEANKIDKVIKIPIKTKPVSTYSNKLLQQMQEDYNTSTSKQIIVRGEIDI